MLRPPERFLKFPHPRFGSQACALFSSCACFRFYRAGFRLAPRLLLCLQRTYQRQMIP